MLPAAALAQYGQYALAEPVGLLEVRVPGQDELGDAERGVLLDPVGDLGMAGASAVAEQVNANAGIGFIISQATQFLRNDVILVALAVYAVLGLLTDALVRQLERRALAWRRGILA